MKVKIKRIDKSFPLPKYHTGGSVAFDFYSRADETIESNETKTIPTNLIIETPPGYMLMVSARSSLGKRTGLRLSNSVGIIDQDYSGENDEIMLSLHNYSQKTAEIKKGDRLAQGMFVRVDKTEWEETDKMNDKSRGGYGSTGVN